MKFNSKYLQTLNKISFKQIFNDKILLLLFYYFNLCEFNETNVEYKHVETIIQKRFSITQNRLLNLFSNLLCQKALSNIHFPCYTLTMRNLTTTGILIM